MKNKRRILARKRGCRSRRRLTALAVILGALAACAPTTEYWTPAESPRHIKVDRVTFHHRVAFQGGAHTLSDEETARLARFIHRFAGEPDFDTRVVVQGAGTGEARLAIRREAAVLARLRNSGLNATLARADDTAAVGAGGVLVTIDRHVVTPPRCPDWSKPADGDPANRVSSNFGCATATNLGLMVADPSTLLRGRDPGPADGEALASAIKSYRKGEASEPAPAVTPLVIQSGVEGAGQ